MYRNLIIQNVKQFVSTDRRAECKNGPCIIHGPTEGIQRQQDTAHTKNVSNIM